MHSFRITPRARDDLKSIGRYTERHWGKTQRNVYLRDLESRFAWLAKNPLLCKKRSEIADGFYSFPQGEHVAFYLIALEGIEIIGIPHKEMDAISYFQLH